MTTWQQFRQRYEAEVVSRRLTLAAALWRFTADDFERYAQPKLLADLTPALIETFAGQLHADGCDRASIEIEVAQLAVARCWAKGEGLLEGIASPSNAAA